MAKARRAQPRPARVVVPIIIIVVALAVVGVVWQSRAGAPTATPDASSPSATSTGTGSDAPSGSDSPGDSASPSARATTSSEAALALEDCRAKVAAGDDVVEAAEQGVGHWSEHVQAQTDNDDGTISADVMSKIFTRTRLAGPDDVSRYDDATKAWDDASGSCDTRDDVSTADNSRFAFCAQRLAAQEPVLAAGADGMKDWESHLAAMKRSRMVHVDNAQQIWIDAWKAAPPHLEAFAKATETYADAPDC